MMGLFMQERALPANQWRESVVSWSLQPSKRKLHNKTQTAKNAPRTSVCVFLSNNHMPCSSTHPSSAQNILPLSEAAIPATNTTTLLVLMLLPLLLPVFLFPRGPDRLAPYHSIGSLRRGWSPDALRLLHRHRLGRQDRVSGVVAVVVEDISIARRQALSVNRRRGATLGNLQLLHMPEIIVLRPGGAGDGDVTFGPGLEVRRECRWGWRSWKWRSGASPSWVEWHVAHATFTLEGGGFRGYGIGEDGVGRHFVAVCMRIYRVVPRERRRGGVCGGRFPRNGSAKRPLLTVQAAVCRAAIHSLAEGRSRGIVHAEGANAVLRVVAHRRSHRRAIAVLLIIETEPCVRPHWRASPAGCWPSWAGRRSGVHRTIIRRGCEAPLRGHRSLPSRHGLAEWGIEAFPAERPRRHARHARRRRGSAAFACIARISQ